MRLSILRFTQFIVLATFIADCRSLMFFEDNWSTNNDIESTITTDITNISEPIIITDSPTTPNTTMVFKTADIPSDCSQRTIQKKQPINNKYSRLKKCCPHDEGLSKILEGNESQHLCDSSKFDFHPNIINAVLYDNCIEDHETDVVLPLEIGNPCNTSLLYNDADDIFYVLQDGSLLIMDQYGNESFTIKKEYCLDMDNVSGVTYAIICITSVEEHIKRGQMVVVAISMLISLPCLLIVSYLHIAIKELRTMHGLSLSLMSLCLATGYFLHALVHIFQNDQNIIGYSIQYFILAYFFWFFCLCSNVSLNIWFKIPRNMRITKFILYCNFAAYCCISFLCPIVFVIMTIQKGFPGMPSYFIQGLTASIRDSQKYFIPPVSGLLFLSFIVMVASFFGFKRMKTSETTEDSTNQTFIVNTEIDKDKYEEVKKDAKCISFLGIILIITWLLEIVTFYSPGPESYLVLLEIINGLQGVFILLIFLVVRRRRIIIFRWWNDRGSHSLESVELSPINKQPN